MNLILFLIFSFSLFACGDDKDEISETEFTNIKWKLTSFVIDCVNKSPELDWDELYWVYFKSDNTLTGFSSSNELMGEYTIDYTSSRIQITKLGGTKVGESFDGNLYIECLKSIKRLSISGETLKLYYNKKDYLLFTTSNNEKE